MDKPPILGKELLQLTGFQLTGFRLHPGPVSSFSLIYYYMRYPARSFSQYQIVGSFVRCVRPYFDSN